MIPSFSRAIAAAACLPTLAVVGALAQTALGPGNSGAPAPAPLGRSIGPPTDNVEEFLGEWKISWTGSVGTGCPCQGKLTIEAAGNGQLIGYWETRSGVYVLRGKVSYDQNSWSGAFGRPNDHSDFPITGQFHLTTRDGRQITGSYQPTRTASSFPVTGTR